MIYLDCCLLYLLLLSIHYVLQAIITQHVAMIILSSYLLELYI